MSWCVCLCVCDSDCIIGIELCSVVLWNGWCDFVCLLRC